MGISISNITVVGEETSTELVQLNICVENSDWEGFFDRIEVQRSRGLSTGPFEDLTASTWAPARVPADGGNEPAIPVLGPTVDAVGDDIDLCINETDEYTITLTDPGTGVINYAEAAAQITAALPQLVRAGVDADGTLVIQTCQAGTAASLQITGGDGAAKLGLPLALPDSLSYGKDARIALLKDKESYTFFDIRGNSSYFYRTRFFNSTNNTASDYSNPQPANQAAGVSASELVCGRVRLAGLNGKALSDVRVRVFTTPQLNQVDGFLITGGALEAITGNDGTAQFSLVRGTAVTVAIDGTDLVREIVVPSDTEEGLFNLLDPSIGPDDYFRVKQPNIEYAQRRSL